MAGYALKVGARVLSWPEICVCCGATADRETRISAFRTTGVRVKHTSTTSWHVPICRVCLWHIRLIKASGAAFKSSVFAWLALFFVVLLLGTRAHSFLTERVVFIIGFMGPGFMGLGVLLWLMGLVRRTRRCTALSRPIRYRGRYGNTHEFVFRNRQVLDTFILANARQICSKVRRTWF